MNRFPETSGTKGYAEEAADLLPRYENISPAEKHQPVLYLIPKAPCDLLDIGAGTGADAAFFAAMGHRVVAAEPVDALRIPAMKLHPSPLIEWRNDSLPDLSAIRTAGRRFDVVIITAVWIHLDVLERQQAMPNVASLIEDGGVLMMSLRHGPAPLTRRMFDVSAEETIQLARANSLQCVLNITTKSLQAANQSAGVIWSRLAFSQVTGG